MKHKFFIAFVLFISLISCKKNNEILINDVTKPMVTRIELNENQNYSTYIIEINGEVNDTILINDKIKLCCKIDTILKFDYYGGDKEIILNYKPYKATNGSLKLNHYAN